jgi:hypothetical protein
MTLTREVTLDGLAQFAITVVNEGDSEATDVRVELTANHGRLRPVSVSGSCSAGPPYGLLDRIASRRWALGARRSDSLVDARQGSS